MSFPWRWLPKHNPFKGPSPSPLNSSNRVIEMKYFSSSGAGPAYPAAADAMYSTSGSGAACARYAIRCWSVVLNHGKHVPSVHQMGCRHCFVVDLVGEIVGEGGSRSS